MRSAEGKDLIVRAALRIFGERGIEAASLREVAKAAGVSPALVVHHFGGKEGLIDAVDETALEAFGAAYKAETTGEPDAGETSAPDLLRLRSEQTIRVMREHPGACAYLGRALVEGTAGSARLFRLMFEGGRAEIDSLAAQGALREDADRLWATLQHFFLIWAPLSFMPLLEREALDGSLLDEGALDRWAAANVDLLRKGLYR
ncbi:MAG TPA: helix-turn-helix domain-containing protein [Solirubrobacterales bacterium]|nr:helix-turn-helix domain-containing protein [Solirubrobacterales bacterium]